MRVIFIILSFAFGLPAAAETACNCVALTPVEAAEQTGIAYAGQVVEVLAARPRASEREVRVRVENAILGVEEGQEIVLRVLLVSNCGIEYPFVEGDEWLFFGTGEYRITLCSPDRPLDARDLAELRRRFLGKKRR